MSRLAQDHQPAQADTRPLRHQLTCSTPKNASDSMFGDNHEA
jgi:hypothetical protein